MNLWRWLVRRRDPQRTDSAVYRLHRLEEAEAEAMNIARALQLVRAELQLNEIRLEQLRARGR